MPARQSLALMSLVALVFAPAPGGAQARTPVAEAPAAGAKWAGESAGASASPAQPAGSADVRQVLLRNGVRLCVFYVAENDNAILVRDAYGNTRSIGRGEIAQMHRGAGAHRMCDRHLRPPPVPVAPAPASIGGTVPAGPKDEGTALALSIGVPLGSALLGWGLLQTGSDSGGTAGAVLFVGGLILGPSAGHMYTGDLSRVACFSLLRTLAFSIGFPPLMAAGGTDDAATAVMMLAVGGVGWFALTAADILDSPASARRANAEAVRALSLSPMVLQEHGGDRQPVIYTGLRLAAAF